MGEIRFASAARALALAICSVLALAPSVARAGTATDEMARCAKLGPKRPGDARARKLAAEIADRFRAAGLQTTFEDFHMPLFVVRDVSLSVVGPGARSVPGETFTFGATGTAEGRVVDVGVGRPEDYAGKDAKGAIVMVRRDVAYHRTSQVLQAAAHGGVAMLYVSGSPGNLIQTGTVAQANERPARIPAVTVGAEQGAALRDQLESGGLRMRVTVKARREDTVARNVIGIRRGKTYPKRIIVLGGHYDSWYDGAVDNCSAVGSLIGVAQAVKDLDPAYTLVFAAWDGEETGLVGSYDWVGRHRTLARRVVANQNFEMTAAAADAGKVVFETASPVVQGIVSTAAANNGYAPARTSAPSIRSVSGGIIPTDLQPFYAQGVQGFSTFSVTPWYHTTQDTVDKVDPASEETVTAFMRDVLQGLQLQTPARLRLREVPRVSVGAPKTARPGARLKVSVRVTDPSGRPLTGGPVRVLVNQRGHWAVAQGRAAELGDGRYRYVIPAGVTEADRTLITARLDRPEYLGEGYARVDQRSGGVLDPLPYACAPKSSVSLDVRPRLRGRRVVRVRATSTRGRARVSAGHVVVDRLGSSRDALTVRVAARTAGGRVIRQARTYVPCATPTAIARAAGGS